MERVYNTLKGEKLQHWLTIVIKREENGDATVSTNSTIHVNKVHPVSFSWGPEYSVGYFERQRSAACCVSAFRA